MYINVKRNSILLCAVMLFCSNAAFAYHNSTDGSRGHQWIIRKAIELIQRCPTEYHSWPIDFACPQFSSEAFPWKEYEKELFEGAKYADHSPSLRCRWDGWILFEQESRCDQLHHYCKPGAVTAKGVTIAKAGIGAPSYADALFDLAVLFWPKGDKPRFSRLRTIRGEWIQGINGLTHLPQMHLGELPYSGRWPNWVSTESNRDVGKEDISTAMRYLGWALHLVQDVTILDHRNNDNSPNHNYMEDQYDKHMKKETWRTLQRRIGMRLNYHMKKNNHYYSINQMMNISFCPTSNGGSSGGGGGGGGSGGGSGGGGNHLNSVIGKGGYNGGSSDRHGIAAASRVSSTYYGSPDLADAVMMTALIMEKFYLKVKGIQ
ncbi:MAG: hypothetical protein QNJ97_26205 [Myxococcota bacterium]|nr:hypothetical protein [Myxococcota bacterium]